MTETTWDSSNVIQATWSQWWILGSSVFALGWGAANALKVSDLFFAD